ncbi:MAG TPA: class I SAM-dependent methyltransferase [Actinomycetota bacterium]
MKASHHPIFARFYTRLSRAMERTEIAGHRDELLDDLAGLVLEVGAGNGMNFAHLPAGVTKLIAIEPEPYLRGQAVEAAARAPVAVAVLAGVAERLPLDDASVDAGVVSLALCSVLDQRAALAELHRVIRPGGELRFYEHVRAETPAQARFQRGVDVVWPLLAGGCHTARDTPRAIEDAGFVPLQVRRFDLGPRFANPAAPHVLGRAGRPGMGP